MPDETNKPPADSLVQKDVVLNHIDKLYTTMTRIWDSINHIILTETIVAILLIILSTGYVDVEEVSAIGIKFKVSLTAILLLGAALVTILHLAFLYQMEASDNFRQEVWRLYGSINYTELSTAYDNNADSFDCPIVYASVIDSFSTMKENVKGIKRLYRSVFGIISGLFMIGVPIVAQIAVGLKVAALYQWTWWVIALFVAAIILTSVCIVAHLDSMKS